MESKMPKPMPRNLLTLAIVSIVIFSVGCGEKPEPTGSLAGQVFSNGKICSDCRLMLYNTSSRTTSGGIVDSQGEFLIENIPLGECKVAVQRQATGDPEGLKPDSRIPQKFQDINTSGFSTSIKEGENSFEVKMEF